MISRKDAFALVSGIVEIPIAGESIRQFAMEQLSQLPGYDWCGVYRLEGDSLVLDEYIGAETDHTVIPVGRGVCGTAIAERANQVVPDVREIENYLACSTTTRSEIVVLIERKGELLGQIDIDSHTVNQFDESDEAMLTEVASILANRWE